jgi:hypothetical protein
VKLLLTVALGVAAVVAPAVAAVAAAPPTFSDTVCPEATAKVIVIGGLTAGSDPNLIYDAAKAASDAYDLCAKRKLSDQDIEPGAHYAYTRAAQFGVLAGRALIVLKRPDEARRELQRDRALAADVASWETSMHGRDPGITVTSDTKYSRFHGSAQTVVDAADGELKKLAASQAPASATSPAPSPSP